MEKEDGYALVNHILKNISLPVGMHTYSNCKNRCMMEDRCKSINMGPEDKDKVLCQISDSDHVQHPNDLKPTEGFTYRAMEVSKKSSVFELAIVFPLLGIRAEKLTESQCLFRMELTNKNRSNEVI